MLDFVAFFVLGSLSLTLAGAACASGRAPYDIVGENLLVVLLAVFNLCGDAAMSILIKRKLNNTMWLVCVGVICAPLGVHLIAILDAWLYRADLSKLTKCNKAVVILALFFSLPRRWLRCAAVARPRARGLSHFQIFQGEFGQGRPGRGHAPPQARLLPGLRRLLSAGHGPLGLLAGLVGFARAAGPEDLARDFCKKPEP